MSKIKLHIDNHKLQAKPEKGSSLVGTINNRITNAVSEVTTAELATLVGIEGRTMVLATMNGKRSKLNMVQQQALALDFDNKDDDTGARTEGMFYQTIADTLEDEFIKTHAAFVYKTFSYTPEWEKFRVVFILDQPLTTNGQVTGAYKHLMEMYLNADRATKDSSRLFFGGTEAIEINFNNVLETAGLPVDEEETYKKVTKNPKTPSAPKVKRAATVEQMDGEEPTYKLIRQGRKEEVKARLSGYGITLADKAVAYEYFRSLPMADVLGIKQNPFCDIFAPDNNPSCSIWKPENTDTWLYAQMNNLGKNGRVKNLDIFQVVQKLLTQKGEEPHWTVPMEYLLEVTGATIEVGEEIAQIREEADRFKAKLLSGTLKEQHPEVYQIFARYNYTTEINAIIDIFMSNLFEDENGEVRLLTNLTIENIAKRIDRKPEKVKDMLNLMTLTFVSNKLSDNEVPSKLLQALERSQTHYYHKGEWVERKEARQYRTNVFELPRLMSNFPKIEERCEAMVNGGFTKKALCREYVIRTFGMEEADRVFPQDEGRVISKVSNAITADIHLIALREIEKKGFIEVNDLKKRVQKKWKSKGFSERKYAQGLAEMLDLYDIKKDRMKKEFKEQLGLPASNSFPTILYKDSSLTLNNQTA